MKFFFRELFKCNVILYLLWFKLINTRSEKKDFFTKDTKLYLDGYPRSGNTFSMHIVRYFMPDLKFVHHLHVVATLKIALLLNIPSIILIRDPLNSISSYYLKYFSMRGAKVNFESDLKMVDSFIDGYLNYYTFVKKKKALITIIKFDELIDKPQILLQEIENKLNVDILYSELEVDRAVNSYRGSTKTLGSSRPNKIKEEYKSIVKSYIKKSKKYEQLLKVYDDVACKK